MMPKRLTSFIAVLFMGLCPSYAHGDAPTKGVDAVINDYFAPVSDAIFSTVFTTIPIAGQDLPLVLIWLAAASVFLTLYLGFVNFRGFGHGILLIKRAIKHQDLDSMGATGHINRFQALTTTLSATVGLGNIGGVAIAISAGGPGATIWMIFMGLFGMTTKFVESTLGITYRRSNEAGRVSGGPMYYLEEGFNRLNLPRAGKALGIMFAICCVGASLGAGNLFQSNQAYSQFIVVTGGVDSWFVGKGWLFGTIMAILVGIVIIGGVRRIGEFTSRIVPFMGGIYLISAILVLVVNYDQVPSAFGVILREAMAPQAGIGALLGTLFQGMQRGAFSNEAGFGSAAIAHSAVKVNTPVSQGFVAMLEPFIDTVVVCTATALVIVVSGAYQDTTGLSGVELTSRGFESVIDWFPILLAIAVILFAFSTMLGWSYYGTKCFAYLFGRSRTAEMLFKLVFCGFIIIGASAELSAVISFADGMFFLMTIPNLIGVYLLAPEVKAHMTRYWDKVQELT
jgi:AGCS family alanine or glycine:cation symporter